MENAILIVIYTAIIIAQRWAKAIPVGLENL
jgi:hypothetical protein